MADKLTPEMTEAIARFTRERGIITEAAPPAPKPTRAYNIRQKKAKERNIAAVVALREKGLSVAAMAKALHVTTRSINNYLAVLREREKL